MSQLSGENPLPRHEILTLLHKTTALLPRALAPRTQAGTTTDSLELWRDILSATYDDLLSKDPRPANIAVYGIDQWSGAQDLITALLEEPLTSDVSLNEQIRTRWQRHSGQAQLTISSIPVSGTSILHASSSFLRQFSVPLQITELSQTHTSPSFENQTSPDIDEQTSDILLQADIAIVVCNPVTTPISVLLRNPLFSRNPNTILVLSSTSSGFTTESLKTHLLRPFPEGTLGSPRILFVDPSRAMAANEALKSDFQSSASVQRYQDNFVGSRVSTVTAALKELIPSNAEPSEASFRAQTSIAHIRAALSACQSSLKRARNEMDGVVVDVCTLKARIEEAKVRAQGEVLSRSSKQHSSKSGVESDVVADAVQRAGKEVKTVMDRLTWWRMAWRVDEISLVVTQAVNRAWCRDLERQLILQTGRLSALQQDMTKSIFTLLAAHPNPPFNSVVLHNSLRQLAASPSFPVTPQTLMYPIITRRAQIIEHPTTRLHVAGQRAVLGMGGGIAAGAGVSWAGWYGWLTGSGEGLLGAVGLDAGTAMGVGLLGAVMGVRWAVGKWERSKRRWWEDWNRVGEGLGRDLRVSLDQTMSDKVLVVASSGCDRLSDLVVQRKGELEELEEELDTLKIALDTLEQRLK
ncbi:hypothetical protein D9615_004628 [Tricholomella constricta]|uniref:Mmc1 C-terminal domain-containing protein n=1 Tax=Tricholomella constricta TaxID=117010 RepID=A0A8H5HBX3_9AGAR|nr:hypothetical protein D9615_004628 [Tricholomella constricta]